MFDFKEPEEDNIKAAKIIDEHYTKALKASNEEELKDIFIDMFQDTEEFIVRTMLEMQIEDNKEMIETLFSEKPASKIDFSPKNIEFGVESEILDLEKMDDLNDLFNNKNNKKTFNFKDSKEDIDNFFGKM